MTSGITGVTGLIQQHAGLRPAQPANWFEYPFFDGLPLQGTTTSNQKHFVMKALSITILILLLPTGACCFSELDAAHLRAGLNLSVKPSTPDASEDKIVKDETENESIRWHYRRRDSQLMGVALVIHGLNGRPDKMEAIITVLNTNGIDCLNLSLRGHGANFSPIDDMSPDAARMVAFKSVSYPLWKTEAYWAYQMAKKKSDLHDRPIFLIGFSMGGLLGVDLMASNPNVRFDKMVLFAPAITMLQRNYLIQIFSPFPNLVIPSAGDKSYLANDGTPMAAYKALFDMHAHFENHLDPRKINIPAIIFIDKEDELVSYAGLQQMVQNHNLDQWRIHSVIKDETATEVNLHHLIIDAASVGNTMWQEIVDVALLHLLGRQPFSPAE
ncbi:MAG: alpha/beta fold hydrolase [Deltaproteobacteria bacterium]|jgi:esterase/lipase|nr:alpha/beta fold hydrolase [Deltaproteobacteria bacterium]